MTRGKFFLIGFFALCFLFLQTVPAFSQHFPLGEIQREMRMKGAKWRAGETSMTRLTHEERLKRLGLIPPVYTGNEPMLTMAAPETEVPTSLDWRANGGNFVTPVRDQGNCGSCWSFATTAALESSALIAERTPGLNLNLSEQVLISCGGAGSCNGGSIDRAANFIKSTGLPGESCYPYTAANGVCSNACGGWQNSTDKISNWFYVATNSPTIEVIKNALYSYGPLVTTMAVYQDFFSYRSGIYHYVSGGLAGYHAVLIVGYNDVGQYLIVKNSWGTYWGEQGYFRIAYSELNSVVGFGDWTIAYVGTAQPCSYSVSQPATFPAVGGSGTVNVTTAGDCTWNASSGASRITITLGSSGTGNGTVYFEVSANTGTARSATITVAGKGVNISQSGGAAPCAYSINPTQQSFSASGGSASVGVTTTGACLWTAVSNYPWITIQSGSSGSGNGTVLFKVAANTGTSTRTGTLKIAQQTFTVTQTGATGGTPKISVSPASLSFGYVSPYQSVSKTVRVTNTGTGRLDIKSLAFYGYYRSQYKQTSSCTSLVIRGDRAISP